MKLRSLLLGSIAVAGMSGLATGAHAADLAKGVLTSLDVCDSLGLAGLTISSDTNCCAGPPPDGTTNRVPDAIPPWPESRLVTYATRAPSGEKRGWWPPFAISLGSPPSAGMT